MIREIIIDSKWKVAFLWGIAIGCFGIFVNEVIGHAYAVSIGSTIALIFIGFFSYFYLHSLLLGALCGFACAIPYFFYTLSYIMRVEVRYWWIAIPAFIFSAFVFATPGVIGGYLAEKKRKLTENNCFVFL